MPKVSGNKVFGFTARQLQDFDFDAFRKAFNREARDEDIASGYKPLAQGKPTRSRATGNASKGRKQAGKGTKPKRGR